MNTRRPLSRILINLLLKRTLLGAFPQSHCSPSSTIPFPQAGEEDWNIVCGILYRQTSRPWLKEVVNVAKEQADHFVAGRLAL